MSSPYLGEIRTVGFPFAPVGWLQCQGQVLNISDYEALYSLIGTTYGGDGQSTFALPDMRSRVNVAAGNGPGLSSYMPGQRAGTEAVTLTTQQMPAHNHVFTASLNASGGGPAVNSPAGNYPADADTALYSTSALEADTLAPGIISGMAQPAGGSQPHANIQPVLALTTIICYEGQYPPQQ
ncbi:phage tail protein [Hymenobacter sediminicola]|uniref:Phage tail protein n=1 Tax=Hymenobacter sediminicola TaxID=2761579 RepID=A0A7G7W9N7_9BACT|nr:tail fiber protein [Hymenobacter sediminicola]QNH63080.1 phage tail protein [Hymenobacter sediminicola]